MRQSASNNPASPNAASPSISPAISKALWVNALLLLAILVVLLNRNDAPRLPSLLPAAYAQQQLPIGGGAGVFIVPGQFSTNTYGCYLMDIDSQTLCAYQYMPAEKQLRLVAARNFRADRRLKNFNSPSPSPDEVQALLDQEANSNRVKEQNNTPVSPEQKP